MFLISPFHMCGCGQCWARGCREDTGNVSGHQAHVFPSLPCRQPPHCVPDTYSNATLWYKIFTTARDANTKYAQDYNPFWCYKGAIGKVYHALNPKLTVIIPDVSEKTYICVSVCLCVCVCVYRNCYGRSCLYAWVSLAPAILDLQLSWKTRWCSADLENSASVVFCFVQQQLFFELLLCS